MSKNSSIVRALILTAIISYPPTTLAQTPSSPSTTNRQLSCLSGYADGTYQGDRPLTRYEFAAGLNACLNQLNQLIPSKTSNLATRADVEALILRQRELNQQLREFNNSFDNPPTQKSSPQ